METIGASLMRGGGNLLASKLLSKQSYASPQVLLSKLHVSGANQLRHNGSPRPLGSKTAPPLFFSIFVPQPSHAPLSHRRSASHIPTPQPRRHDSPAHKEKQYCA